MTIRLDHTIVEALDREETAHFLGSVLGLATGAEYGPFLPVDVDNGVTLDVMRVGDHPSVRGATADPTHCCRSPHLIECSV